MNLESDSSTGLPTAFSALKVHSGGRAPLSAAQQRTNRKANRHPAAQKHQDIRFADARSTARTLFRQLASALHPDRETDEQERLRKAKPMSEANTACGKNDLSALLGW